MKYPRTPHMPWSISGTADDERIADMTTFHNMQVVCTEKLDGENTVMSRDTIHARSETGYSKPWQSFLKKEWARIRFDIPHTFQICGENMYAVHSIEYTELTSSFYVFGIFENDYSLPWNKVIEYSNLLGLKTVPIIRYGIMDDFMNMPIPDNSAFGGTCEGYVIRNVNGFLQSEFSSNVIKCVRKDHVQTDIHWTKTWKKANIVGE